MSQVSAAEELEYDDPSDDESSYRTFSGTAILGCVLGLISAASFEHPVFLLAAVLGIVFSAAALRRIAVAMPPPMGRSFAIAGLAFSLVFGVGTVTGIVYRGAAVESQARTLAAEFFDHLAAGEVHRAHQLTLSAENRQPANADLWAFYREDQKSQDSLRSFVRSPGVRSLVALGDQAQLRLYQMEAQEGRDGYDGVTAVYAVTYDRRGEKHTFFMSVKLVHARSEVTAHYEWSVHDPLAGMEPKGWRRFD